MSLLDRGPHTCLVQLMKQVPDTVYGGTKKVPDGAPILVKGVMVQPITSDEAYALGVRPDTSFRVIGRTWPGGMFSEVTWVDENNRKLFQRGETQPHTIGRLTRHRTAVLVANSAEVK